MKANVFVLTPIRQPSKQQQVVCLDCGEQNKKQHRLHAGHARYVFWNFLFSEGKADVTNVNIDQQSIGGT